MSFDQTEFGNRLRERRKSLGITQNELAITVGVTSEYISRLERGIRTPSVDVVIALSKALSTTCNYLLTGEMDVQTEVMTILYKALNDLKGS